MNDKVFQCMICGKMTPSTEKQIVQAPTCYKGYTACRECADDQLHQWANFTKTEGGDGQCVKA